MKQKHLKTWIVIIALAAILVPGTACGKHSDETLSISTESEFMEEEKEKNFEKDDIAGNPAISDYDATSIQTADTTESTEKPISGKNVQENPASKNSSETDVREQKAGEETTAAASSNASVKQKHSDSPSEAAPAVSHTHVWKDHIAQRWVSKMVTVDDYETKTISGARFYTLSGTDANGNPQYTANGPTYWLENGFTQEDLKNIIKTGITNADSQGLYNGVYYGNYQNVTKTEKVKTGSHQEDQGYYENYVDYQYCSCGATK